MIHMHYELVVQYIYARSRSRWSDVVHAQADLDLFARLEGRKTYT
jgi:hypothetical protein